MSAHILLNFLRVGEEIKCEAEPGILSLFCNKLSKFINIVE